MFSVAVIRLRDLAKYIIVMTVIITIIIFAKRFFNQKSLKNIDFGQKISTNIGQYVEKAINLEIPEVEHIQKQNNNDKSKDKSSSNQDEDFQSKWINKILGLELGIINLKEENLHKTELANNNEIKKEDTSNKEKNTTDNEKEPNDDKNIELAKTDVKTKVITKNPLADVYTQKYNGVKIKNETSFDLTDEDLNSNNLKINKSNIIIFHTHTCESYTSSEKYSYTPTGNFRTTDKKYSVVRVGDELTKYLKKYKMNVVHDKTYHDYPSYSGSYSRSLATVSKLLKTTDADIIIDLHRDAIGSNSSYAPTVKRGNEECAQLMFGMGSNGGGLKHPNWKKNLQFAVKIQAIANKTYPNLFKPIILRNSRYNQHLSKAACIIEVGSTGNTLEQCLNSMKYLSEVINEFK